MEITLQIIVCFFIADFLTGFFHWFEDTWVTPKTPFIGKSIGIPNIKHHRNPGLIARMGTFISRNMASVMLALIGIVIFAAFGILSWKLILIAILAALGNEVHEWNHATIPKNSFVAFMQDAGMVQTKQQHALHHKKPYDKYFCTLGNFTNAVLERIRFWKGAEWFCVTVFRMKKKRMSPEREGY